MSDQNIRCIYIQGPHPGKKLVTRERKGEEIIDKRHSGWQLLQSRFFVVMGERWKALVQDKLFQMGILYTWIIASVGLFHFFLNIHSPYFQFGPTPTLRFISEPINTWTKWCALAGYRIGSRMLEMATIDVVEPWTITHIQNEDQGRLPYERWKCALIVHSCILYRAFELCLQLYFLTLQFDILLIETIGRMIVLQSWTLRRWMANKTTPSYRSPVFNGDDGASDSGYMLPPWRRPPIPNNGHSNFENDRAMRTSTGTKGVHDASKTKHVQFARVHSKSLWGASTDDELQLEAHDDSFLPYRSQSYPMLTISSSPIHEDEASASSMPNPAVALLAVP
jgi:hypothetical protein